MNKVLVLLAAHNGNPWIKDQVVSILEQKNIYLQLVIGDDCSSDGSVDQLKQDFIDNESIEFYRFDSPSGGAGLSFFRLIREVNLLDADFVAFSDQDDQWHVDKLANAIAMLDSHGADAYSSAVVAHWPDGREKVLGQNPNCTDLDFLFEGAGQGCTFVLRREFAIEVQSFVRKNYEKLSRVHYHDWLIYSLARCLNKRWVFDHRPSMRYRQHGGNDTGARSAFSGIQKRIGLIKSGWYANQVRQIVDMARLVEGGASIPKDFSLVWGRSAGLNRRLWLAGMLFVRGRRRFLDRAVLASSSLLGWL